jgi:DNA-binding transcriptional MerR regulator
MNFSNDHRQLIRISELARRSGVTTRAIRYYEECGLLSPAERTTGGFRLYNSAALQRLKIIRSLQQAEMPLQAMRSIMAARQRPQTAKRIAPEFTRLLTRQVREVEVRIRQSQELRELLIGALRIFAACAECSLRPNRETCTACPATGNQGALPVHLHAMIEAASPAEKRTASPRRRPTSNVSQGHSAPAPLLTSRLEGVGQ